MLGLIKLCGGLRLSEDSDAHFIRAVVVDLLYQEDVGGCSFPLPLLFPSSRVEHVMDKIDVFPIRAFLVDLYLGSNFVGCIGWSIDQLWGKS
ncbi:MAG: hypothetical protein GWN86_17895 [Desulfobacterales bacterium]|nr:hypothetical protein [Desulfobacterales bacterium]